MSNKKIKRIRLGQRSHNKLSKIYYKATTSGKFIFTADKIFPVWAVQERTLQDMLILKLRSI